MKSKVVFLGPVPPPIMGPTIATEIILKSKLKDNFDLIHLDTSDHRELGRLAKKDYQNFYLAIKHYLLLCGLILKNWPALVYIPVSQTSIGFLRDSVFILISKLFGRKVICHLRGGNFFYWYTSANDLMKYFVRKIYAFVDGQIVLGESLKFHFEKLLPNEKIFVVPNGMNLVLSTVDQKISDKIRILFLSNLTREKGVMDVLSAFIKVFDDNKKIAAVFAGKWRGQDLRQEFIKVCSSRPNLPVKMIGPVYGRAKEQLLKSSDIFVFPTYYRLEGHPWAIVEAMAAGLPIITTDQGAITESVKDGQNGIIVEKNNPGHIAEKIKYLVENPEIRRRMGEESRRLYLENFTEDKMVERLSAVFLSVLAD